MIRPTIAGVSAFLLATPALAAADLAVSLPAPAPAHVYESATYEVEVANVGNRNADDVTLTIALPETHTSPQVYVMGELGSIDGRCTQSGTELVCDLGRIRKNRSTTVSFDLELPQADEVLEIVADASTSSSESNLANNEASLAPSLLSYSTTVSAGDVAQVEHCTGQGLTSFYECVLSPSSISSHIVELGSGTLSFPGQDPGYGGTWSQPSADQLSMTYTYNGSPVAQFDGWGTSPGCFEGITTFPGSAWVSPYEVCF